jgi:hypothetical protein
MTAAASFVWLSDVDQAGKLADQEGKLVLLDFFSPT